MAKRRTVTEAAVLRWIPVLSVLGSVLVAGIVWTAWVARNVAQTSYVDEVSNKQLKYIDIKIAESIKYTDEKITNLRKESNDHSDMNKSNMESEYKSLSAKLDMLIIMVQQQQAIIARERK